MVDVALLGTGRMGAALARRLADRGHSVTVWNRTAAAAHGLADDDRTGRVVAVDSAADAVRGQAVVLAVLADGDATRSVLLDSAVRSALPPGAVVCDLGTSGVATAHALAAGLAEVGVRFVDAPVSGSVPAVQAGTLLVMAAGDPDAINAARAVLSDAARAVVRVGAPGAGQAMKLAVNLVVHDLNAALAEALKIAENAGIARADAYDVLEQSVVAAPYVQYKRAAFLTADTPVAMSLDLVAKDLGLITAFAAELGVDATLTRAACEVVSAARDAGFGDRDMADLSRFKGAAAGASADIGG